jgi:hypothetical protein
VPAAGREVEQAPPVEALHSPQFQLGRDF